MTLSPSSRPWAYGSVITSVVVLTSSLGRKRDSWIVELDSPVAAGRTSVPLATITLWSPIQDCVVLVTTGTAAAAPMLAVPDTEMLPEIACSSVNSDAATRMLPSASRRDPSASSGPPSTYAMVVMFSTETPALTVTAAVPPTAAPAEIDRMSSLEIASTVMLPRTSMSADLPIQARVFLVTTCTSTPTPTPAVPPTASAPATELTVVVSLASTATLCSSAAPALSSLTVVLGPR